MRIGSLFSGAAALDRAVEAVFGGETVWHAEVDKAASKVLAYHYPNVPNLGDITEIDWATVEPVDVLCGGYPCQPFSAAGKRQGADDDRHLWPFVVEALAELRPETAVFENVRGHLSLGFGDVMADLEELGYRAKWCVLAASDVGAPHRRQRIFITAKDKYARRICGRDHRRGGLYSAGGIQERSGVHLCGGDHVGESLTAADEIEAPLWREHTTTEEGQPHKYQSGHLLLAQGRPRGHRIPAAHSPAFDPERRPSRLGDLVVRDGFGDAPSAGEGPAVVGRGEADRCPCPGADGRVESHGASTSEYSGAGSVCDPRGWPVGDDATQPARHTSERIHGTVANARAGDRRTVLRDGGSVDAAVRSDGHVELLPTPCVVDRLATGEMTLDEWDESRRTQKEKGVGSFGPRGDSLGAAVLRVEEGVVDQRPDYSTTKARSDGHVDLLPTPAAKDGSGGCIEGTMGGKRPSGAHRTIPLATAVHHMLLPTPNASDASGGGQHPDKRVGHSRQLIDYALLCTPSASDGAGGKTSRSGGRIDEPLLGGQAREMATAWGKYEPAIRRWEALTREAPPPTEPNKNGNPRLAAAFSEWLMGWPEGWVTDPAIGISRNDQLRIVGNGVCSQQAAAALRFLLAVAA